MISSLLKYTCLSLAAVGPMTAGALAPHAVTFGTMAALIVLGTVAGVAGIAGFAKFEVAEEVERLRFFNPDLRTGFDSQGTPNREARFMSGHRLLQAGQPGHLSDILAQVAGALAQLTTDDEPLKQVILAAMPDLRREALRLEQIAIEYAGRLEQVPAWGDPMPPPDLGRFNCGGRYILPVEVSNSASPAPKRIATADDMASLGPALRRVAVEGPSNILILPVVRRSRWPVQTDAGDETDGGDAA